MSEMVVLIRVQIVDDVMQMVMIWMVVMGRCDGMVVEGTMMGVMQGRTMVHGGSNEMGLIMRLSVPSRQKTT